MSRDFDYEIRDALTDLAGEGRSVNLAEAAIREGRHIVRRRRVVSATATFAVLAVLVVPFLLHRTQSVLQQPGAAPAVTATPPDGSTAPLPASALPSPVPTVSVVDPVPGLVALPDGMLYGSIALTDGDSLVYNRTTSQYVRLPFGRVIPAPVGTVAAVSEGRRVGLVDLDSGKVRWASGPAPANALVDWSPDGTELTYLAKGTKSGTVQIAVLVAGKTSATTVGTDIVCPASDCAPAWLPDGKSIAVSGASGKLSIRLVDPATGKPAKGLERVAGMLANGHGVSDDGTLAVTEVGNTATVTVVETGQTVLELPVDAAEAYWSNGHDLLVVGSDGVVVYSLQGERLAGYQFPTGTLAKSGWLPILIQG